MKAIENSVEWYRSSFRIFEQGLNGESKTRIHALRRDALERFAELGFPTTRNEEWKFTNVSAIAREAFKPAPTLDLSGVTAQDIEQFALGDVNANTLVFINGHYAVQLSSLGALPHGVMVGSVRAALQSESGVLHEHLTRYAPFAENAFIALNTAFMQDGAFIVVPDGKIVEEAVHLIYVSTDSAAPLVSNPRNLIVAGRNSRVSVVETYVSLTKKSYFTNAVSEIVLGKNAVFEHDKLQRENEDAFHVHAMHIHQSDSSNFTSNSISLGGAIVRNDVKAVLDGSGIECTLNGLSLATGNQHVDNHTTIDHAKPQCVSHELYKSILDGRAKGVFNGKIFVRKDAQKTDAKQTNKTLLLSDDATIDTKPQLEIFADDVKCTHGATVGQLDEEQVFYLRARGLDEVAARDILTFAFAGDVIKRVHVDSLRVRLEDLIHARLHAGRLSKVG